MYPNGKMNVHIHSLFSSHQWSQLAQDYPLKEEMATHSSVLAGKTPWTEEPGRLQFVGSDITE